MKGAFKVSFWNKSLSNNLILLNILLVFHSSTTFIQRITVGINTHIEIIIYIFQINNAFLSRLKWYDVIRKYIYILHVSAKLKTNKIICVYTIFFELWLFI